MKDGIVNAKIVNARICDNDHGFYSVLLDLDYGGISQTFGSHGLTPVDDQYKNDKDWKLGYSIKRIMAICEVSNFSNIKGCYVKVMIHDNIPVAIGNILKDSWFDPKKEMWHDVHSNL